MVWNRIKSHAQSPEITFSLKSFVAIRNEWPVELQPAIKVDLFSLYNLNAMDWKFWRENQLDADRGSILYNLIIRTRNKIILFRTLGWLKKRFTFLMSIFVTRLSYLFSKIVYYVPRQSSWCLYSDAVLPSSPSARTLSSASSYKQLNCLGAYNTLSAIRKRKREFVCRGAEFKLRLIVLRTCTCGVISHLYRNKLDVAERG